MIILQQVGVPIYLQVKNYILERISKGELQPGARIPTERQLAIELEISRNTVSAAYKALLDEGIIEVRQGRGTFVKKLINNNSGDITGRRRERALKFIDQAIVQVLELGFTVEQFAAIAGIRAKEKAQAVKELRVAIVDYTLDYIQRFATQIVQLANVQIEGIVLDDLNCGKVSINLLHSCDLIITTVTHQNAVIKMTGNSSKVIAVSTVPNLEAIIKLAKLPVNTGVGIVAETVEFADALERLLLQTNISGLKMECLIDTEEEILRKYVARLKVLVVSPSREMLIRRIASAEHDIIPFYYEIDQGSLQQILARFIAQTE